MHNRRKASLGVGCHAALLWTEARPARTHEAVEEGREVQHRAPAGARVADEQRVHLPQAPPGGLSPREPEYQKCCKCYTVAQVQLQSIPLGLGSIPLNWSPSSRSAAHAERTLGMDMLRYATPGLVMQPGSTQPSHSSLLITLFAQVGTINVDRPQPS